MIEAQINYAVVPKSNINLKLKVKQTEIFATKTWNFFIRSYYEARWSRLVSTMCFTTKTYHVSEMKQVVKSLKVKSGSRKQFLICFLMKYRDFSVKINSERTIFIFTVCPKGLKCSILVWNYGEDVNILRSNLWRHLLRWCNAFSARDVRWTTTDCSIFLDRFLAFHRFKCYLGSFSRYITVFFTQYYTP